MTVMQQGRSTYRQAWSWLRSLRPPDTSLVLLILPLIAIGLIYVFSASYPVAGFDRSRLTGGDSFYYLKRQAMFAIVGLGMMWVMSLVPSAVLRRIGYVGYWAAGAMLLAVLILGPERNGAHRWMFGMQPSEFARLLGIVALARVICEKAGQMQKLPTVMRICALAAPLILLVLVEPHLAGAVLFSIVLFGMLHVGGARARHLGLIGVATALAAVLAVVVVGYRSGIVKARLGGGYHTLHCQMAFGAGGLGGRGFGESREKYFYLPEPHTDSILAIIGEEMGFFATLGVITLFGLLAWRMLQVAARASDEFDVLLTSGIAFAIGFEALINMASVTGLGAATGLPLPLVSYGGSSVLGTFIGIGIVLGVSRQQAETVPVRVRGSRTGRVLRVSETRAV
jgi:cell division protein FtsW